MFMRVQAQRNNQCAWRESRSMRQCRVDCAQPRMVLGADRQLSTAIVISPEVPN